jgi:2,4-dienoyl-CoA reductase-like NADH-dependent reductase (Old Yellow Enzyme family)
MTIHYISGEDSALFRPLTISNGALTLRHRIIHAPLTRNRGVPLNPNSTPENPNRIWVPGDLVVDYYAQRATEGGLIISEGIPPSLEVWFCGSPLFSVLRAPFLHPSAPIFYFFF